MKKIIRTTAAVAAFTVASIGVVGVASAEEPEYVSDVKAATQVQDPGTQAVTAAGTLPYTGNDSSLPLAEAGIALLAGGGALMLVVKRRQSQAA